MHRSAIELRGHDGGREGTRTLIYASGFRVQLIWSVVPVSAWSNSFRLSGGCPCLYLLGYPAVWRPGEGSNLHCRASCR